MLSSDMVCSQVEYVGWCEFLSFVKEQVGVLLNQIPRCHAFNDGVACGNPLAVHRLSQGSCWACRL